ncbi:MAG: radical SAM/SPASM domain-containing protein [Oscillospiraceae bacterium]|jgi:MoaA/NifB/PqqE/SkfB family radical SAM enzyme|nr:radical SAM/SPASM domain-containing protein [Oscillospiraceae bacterium]
MLKRVYIEITNVCNLRCDFCPGTRREARFLSPAELRLLAGKLRGHTSYLYFHVMGEPLLHPELGELLGIAAEEGFRACLTTNGTLLEEKTDLLLAAPALHKLSVSLHSAEGNGLEKLGDYLAGVWESALALSGAGVICALRLWNIGGAEERNGEIYAFLREKLGVHPLELPRPRQGSWRLGERLYLERAEKFDWPDLDAPETGTRFCLGLRDQAAVLCDGTVVPCCLDHEGDVPLGNLLEQELEEILASPRARAVYEGFSQGKPSEELCRRCGFAARFG